MTMPRDLNALAAVGVEGDGFLLRAKALRSGRRASPGTRTFRDSLHLSIHESAPLSSGPFRSSVSGSLVAPLLQLDVVVNQVFLVEEEKPPSPANSQAATAQEHRRAARLTLGVCSARK